MEKKIAYRVEIAEYKFRQRMQEMLGWIGAKLGYAL